MIQTKIGKFIAALRKENGMTQEQLGKKPGVTNKTVSRWKNGLMWRITHIGQRQ